MAGRKTKLTLELQTQIIKAIQAGNYDYVACEYVGIHKSTFYRWMARGEKGRKGIYKEFSDSIKKANASSEIWAVAFVRSAMANDWRAAMTYLERKFPDRWARKEKLDITSDNKPLPLYENATDSTPTTNS